MVSSPDKVIIQIGPRRITAPGRFAGTPLAILGAHFYGGSCETGPGEASAGWTWGGGRSENEEVRCRHCSH
jgi:hypothetical protein